MLSIKACRKCLKNYSKDLTDDEIENVRDLMYQFAFVMVEDYLNNCKNVVPISAERKENGKSRFYERCI